MGWVRKTILGIAFTLGLSSGAQANLSPGDYNPNGGLVQEETKNYLEEIRDIYQDLQIFKKRLEIAKGVYSTLYTKSVNVQANLHNKENDDEIKEIRRLIKTSRQMYERLDLLYKQILYEIYQLPSYEKNKERLFEKLDRLRDQVAPLPLFPEEMSDEKRLDITIKILKSYTKEN